MIEFQYNPDAIKEIRRLSQKMSATAIANIIGCDISMVERICREHNITFRARDYGALEPEKPMHTRKAVKKAMEIEIDEQLLLVVKRDARQRGLDTHTLIERLIEKIAKDGLFNILER